MQRRGKRSEKSVGQRKDALPWELPDPLDATWSSALSKNLSTQFSCNDAKTTTSTTTGPWRDPQSHISRGKYPGPNFNFPTRTPQNEGRNQPWPSTSKEQPAGAAALVLAGAEGASGVMQVQSPLSKAKLPPIGVFWDIENCAVPKGRSALVTVQRIREKFFFGHVETEFICVCDVRKESPSVIQELNDAQVSVIHVSGNSKNAADEKLRQMLRRFSDVCSSNPVNSEWIYPATVILISGDINFVADLSDLRYRKRLYIILLHNKQAPDALLLCSHEQYEFHSLLTDLPFRPGYREFSENPNDPIPLKGGLSSADLILSKLPLSSNVRTQNFIRNRLRKLSDNCGGKIVSIRGQWAVIRFPNQEAALRASKRMNGEDVLGNKIRVVRRQHMDFGKYLSNAQEDLSNDSFDNMQCNKHNYFGTTVPTWKPTWRGHSANDSFGQAGPSTRPHQALNEYKYQIMGRPETESSSSTDTRGNDSPVLLVQDSISIPSQLNNSTQLQSSKVNNICCSKDAGSAQLSFHQNLYPSLDCGIKTAPVVRQEYHLQPQASSSYQLNVDANVSGGGPRLYSTTMTAPENDGSMAPGQHSYSFQADSLYGRPPLTVNNRMNHVHKASPASILTSAEQPFGETIGNAQNASPENYPKFRSQDGDSFDLTVTNIDPNIGDWRAVRAALNNAFSGHVGVKGIWVSVAPDGSAIATVRLNSKEEAHYAVAQLHRRKVGNKRIFISFEQGHSIDYGTLKKEVASLLQDVPNHTLPLFKFREMFEKRYKRSVSSSDLYRMKDVVVIRESSSSGSGISTPSSGRNISLAPSWQAKEGKGVILYCNIHAPKTFRSTEKLHMGWAEKEAEVTLPNVIIEVKTLGTQIHSMLQSHEGGFPLISFLDCYEAEHGSIEIATEGRGVPLEHLISCVQGVEIVLGENGMKRVQWHEKKDDQNALHQPLAKQLTLFGRELIDLLKTFPKCTLPFSKLIPSYHAHFGRQCRVADYGHFRLIALLQTLPHIIQIMGAAQNRVLTLSHRAQMKRFATDMLRVLNSQGGPKKQIRMDDFASAFFNVFSPRQFQPEDYGLCFFSDLVTELVEHSTLVALMKDEDGQFWLAVPKREQTPHEIYRTQLFAAEVVELLRHSTRCELEFSKFVPYYHHHFQKQCRVSDYGFGKLAELFDAISDTVVIINNGGNDAATEDKIIRLTPKEQVKVVGEQVCTIVEKRTQDGLSTKLEDLIELFLEEHGFFLRPELCGASCLNDLVSNKLETFLKVKDDEITVVDRLQIEELSQKAEIILQHVDEYTMTIDEFISALSEKCDIEVGVSTIEKDLCQVLVVSETEEKTVSLSPLRIFAYEMTLLLEEHNGSVPLSSLENLYFEKFSQPIRPAQLGYPTVLPMLQAVSDVLTVTGKQRTKRAVVLNSVKAAMESTSTSDDSSSTYGRHTPRNRNERYKLKEGRYSGGSIRRSKYSEGLLSRRRSSAPQSQIFSPLSSPATFTARPEVFTFDRHAPMTPPLYDMWVQETVTPGSPPMSPPVLWTCHPVFYPQSPTATGPGNILVTSPYVAPAPWSPPPISSGCYEQVPAAQPGTMLGSEFLFGQTHRLASSFEKLSVSNEV